jgi:hypothetical protein
MNFLTNLLDLNKITAKTAFIILLISGGLMFLPADFLAKLEIAAFKKEFGKYFGFAFLASAAFLIVALLNWIQQKVNSRIRKRKWAKNLKEAINKIDFSEVKVLREFPLNGQQSLDMPIDDPVVAGMLNKGILYQLSSMGQMSREGMMMPVAINSLISDQITPEFLGLPRTEPSQQEIDKILNARPDWAKSVTARKSNRWYY